MHIWHAPKNIHCVSIQVFVGERPACRLCSNQLEIIVPVLSRKYLENTHQQDHEINLNPPKSPCSSQLQAPVGEVAICHALGGLDVSLKGSKRGRHVGGGDWRGLSPCIIGFNRFYPSKWEWTWMKHIKVRFYQDFWWLNEPSSFGFACHTTKYKGFL